MSSILLNSEKLQIQKAFFVYKHFVPKALFPTDSLSKVLIATGPAAENLRLSACFTTLEHCPIFGTVTFLGRILIAHLFAC